MAVGFPDPVGGGFGHCAKALLAGLQGAVALLQSQQAFIYCPGTAQGVAEQVEQHQAKHQEYRQQRRQEGMEQLAARQRRVPYQVITGFAEGDMRLSGLSDGAFLQAHAGQTRAFAQNCELGFGQLVDEHHHRRLFYISLGHFLVRAYCRGAEHCGPAVEAYEVGYLLAGRCCPARRVDDCRQGAVDMGASRRRLTDVLFVICPLPVDLAYQMCVGGVPDCVAGEELARGHQPLFQCLRGLEGALLQRLAVQRGGDVEQCHQGEHAGEPEQRAETAHQAAHLQARGGSGG
ncbi:hypothetical protein WR25_25864 [Diploscapter pachys]|uniref:Uncharacterized protein n=1 Tax=Diploscapter pachys TaxID=2018661 RepID=A0A2A2K5X6_9BILA|nr:hypothetical protein WR25_25864 [Diploscapter pachys]